MNQTLPDVALRTEALAPQEPMTVLLAYRDAEHENLGKTFWQSLSRHLACAGGVRVSEWKFEMIASAALNPLATAESQETSVILLATQCGEGLPDKVVNWLENWFARRVPASFLVVLLTENLAGSAAHWPDYSRLVVLAREAGTELIICPIGASGEQRSVSLFAQSWRVGPTGLARLGDLQNIASLLQPRQKVNGRCQ